MSMGANGASVQRTAVCGAVEVVVTFGCWGLRVVLSELMRKGLEAEAKARRDMKAMGSGGGGLETGV